MGQITIGKDTLGGTLVQMPPGDNKAVCRFQNTNADPITITKAYGSWLNSYPSAKVRVVIYSDTTGPLPNNLLGYSDEKVGISATTWDNEFNFSTPVVVNSGDYVWIGIISDTMCLGSHCHSSGTIIYNSDTYSNGPSSTFGAASNAPYTYPIFCYGDDGELKFGRSSINGGTGTYNADQQHADKFVLGGTDDIEIDSISTYIKTTSGSVKTKAAIYTDSGGVPGSLIAQTEEVIGSTADSWITLDFVSPVTISPGTYWLCFIADTNLTTTTIPVSGHLRNNGTLTEASAWPSTSASYDVNNTPKGLDIYATYTISVGGGGTAFPVIFTCT